MTKKTQRRLLVICPKGDINSGGIVSNFELIKYLVHKGYVVHVITSWNGTYNKALTTSGITNTALDYNWWTPKDKPEIVAGRVMKAVVDIVGIINSFKPDVVVTNTSHIPWGALAASFTNTPHVWTLREFPINNFSYLEPKLEFIHAYSNRLIANSKELASYLRTTYHYDVDSFMSYVDVSGFTLAQDSHPVRLVSPNYISQTKNQIELVRAATILAKRRPDLLFRILLVGEKEVTHWPVLQKTIEQSGIEDRFDIFDRVDNPWSMISSNDIFVQTSMSESIGRATTEAMKLGVPVIASDIPGHREAFQLGGGVLYELGSPTDLAKKIEAALDEHAALKRRAIAIQKRALARMSSDASSEPFLRAVEAVVGNDNPMKANKHIAPFIVAHEVYVQRQEAIIRIKNDETDFLQSTIEDIRHSKSYRLGTVQTAAFRKVAKAIHKLRARQ